MDLRPIRRALLSVSDKTGLVDFARELVEKYGVELIANLNAVPPSGATIIVGAPKHEGASGGPCRVYAVV